MFSTVLVADRGESAIRVLRAAHGLGARTVAVFTHEDRSSEHRLRADEAHEIGRRGHADRAHLDPDEVVEVAVRSGADAVHPGHGLLAEDPRLAAACAEAGVTFVGPSPEVLTLTGDAARVVAAARAAGVPVPPALDPAVDLAVVPERARPGRHLEVQVLADATGDVVHLVERDCSVRRGHRAVVAIAPAPRLDPATRERMCGDAVRVARAIGYRNAGTVELLLDDDGRYVVTGIRPRLQAEHTVTEEVTDVDLVQAQLWVAAGGTLADLGLSQDAVSVRGVALQVPVTTEDPANGFRPATGRVTAYRSPGGPGVRLDGRTTCTGAEVSAHDDPVLTTLTCRGRTLEAAVATAQRAVAELRVEGVATNLPVLRALLDDPGLVAGRLTTPVAEAAAAPVTADGGVPAHVVAPFQGVVTLEVLEGDEVADGQTLATIEAMKMEASITAPRAGTVRRVALSGTATVDGGDLVLVLA